jgi:hypothetical protein
MIRLTLIILIGIFPSLRFPFIQQQQKPLLTIDFSLDSKANDGDSHIAILYLLSDDGEEINVRDVHNSAMQESHHRQLPKSTVAKIVDLMRKLPDSEETNIPKEWLVTLTFREGNDVKVSEYHRKTLPHAFKEVLELLGGIRFELRDTIEFSPPGN